MKSKLSLTLPLFFVPIIHQKKKKKQFVGLLIKKKFLKQLKFKKKKKKIEAIKCCNKIKLKMLDY